MTDETDGPRPPTQAGVSPAGRKRPEVLAQEQDGFPRTVGRPGAPCECSAVFRLEFSVGTTVLDRVLFANTGGEVTLRGNQTVGIQVKILTVGPFAGSLSFSFSRDGANAAAPIAPGPFAANDLTGLKNQLSAVTYTPISAPPGLTQNNPSIIETLTATVTWTPQGQGGCSLTETVRLVWQFAVNPQDNTPPSYATHLGPAGPRKTGVSVGKTMTRKPTAPPTDPYVAALEAFYSVADVTHCCGVQRGYAVIQFIRHRWRLDEATPKTGGDAWTVDVLDSQVTLAGQNQPFDPTYTHNPLGSNPGTPPVVYPGPNATDGSSSIVQVDAPGLPPQLYARFLAAGGVFAWQIQSFLVCQLTPSTVAAYTANGSVTQSMRYQIEVTFPGKGAAPTVSGSLLEAPKTYNCVSLTSLLQALDKDPAAKGQFSGGLAHPRGHQIAI